MSAAAVDKLTRSQAEKELKRLRAELASADEAYHAKYDRFGPAIVGTVVGEKVVPVTIRLLPRDPGS